MNPWKEQVLAYNRAAAIKREKAEDLDVILQEVFKLPHGQLKKFFTDEVITVLKKYGYTEE